MNSSLIKRLSAINLTAFLLIAAVGGAAWWQFDRVVANQTDMGTTSIALRNQMEADMMHDALRADVLSALHAVTAKDAAAGEQTRKGLAGHTKHFRDMIAENQKLTLAPKAAAAIKEITLPLENYIAAAESEVALAFKDAAAAEAQLPAFVSAFSVLEDKMNAVSDVIEESGKTVQAQSVALVSDFHRLLGQALAVSFVLLVILSVLVARLIPRPFQKIVRDLSDTAVAAAHTSTKVAQASQELASGASQQAASLEETSASLEEMTSMTKRTAVNAQTAKELGNQTRHAADTGAVDMQAMTAAMDEIKTSSDNIAKIVKTIDEIAFQTNLLALNAAVEAARAGEAGMGFAVVADEVRALAQRSAVAAKETTARIEDSIRKSERGVIISGKVGQSLQEIVTKARQMDELISEIAQASNEQTQGISQINSAVGQMDQVTQGAAGCSSLIAESSEDLRGQAAALNGGITALRQLVGEGTADKTATEKVAVQQTPAAAPTPVKPLRRAAKPAGRAEAAIPFGTVTTPASRGHAPVGGFKDF